MALAADLKFIKELEEQLFNQTVRGSPDAVAALLSDDFLEFGRSGGIHAKEDTIRGLANEESDRQSELTAYGYEFRILAQDVVLLTYRTVRRRAGTAELHSLRSSIWKVIDGRWKMAFHQGTPTTA